MATPIQRRIKWRDVVNTLAFKMVKTVLHGLGYDLIVEFDKNLEATDVYVVNTRG